MATCCSSPRRTSSSATTPGSSCGVGPVEAAAATARALASTPPAAVVHVGIAGGRGITPGGLVIGSESVYSDIAAEIPVVDRVEPDAELLARVRAGVPDALVLPIGTSAAVGGASAVGELRVEAMEGFGVLRACALAGVPAVEIRAISNELVGGRPLALADRPRARGPRGRASARARGRRSVASAPMAARQKRDERPLPPPLPPAQRTVGQLVGEAIRAYGARFWRRARARRPGRRRERARLEAARRATSRLALLPLTALLVSISYVLAVGLVNGVPVRSRRGVVAYVVAVLVFLPVPLLVAVFILPGLVWLSLFGLAVPAVLVEGLGVRAAFRRGLALARVDFVHVLGGLATLALVVIISQFSLYFVLREYADNTRMIAAALAVARRLAGRLPRERAALRRPGGSVTLARGSTKGVRCRPT